MIKSKLNKELEKQIVIRTWIRKSPPLYPKHKFPHQTHASS